MNAARAVRFALAAACLLALGACAARTAPAPDPGPEQITGPVADREMWEAATELELHKAELAQLQGLAACAEVCRLSELVCAAGARICAIAQRHESNSDYANRCLAAKGDCRSARDQCGDCK
ncbi:MAG: hypothetical protein ACOX6T_07745 [Myxococcales bacterium]|jgi:hypothetical protein